MGMAASQARLLSITSRLHDVEYKAQNLQNAKLQLSTQQDAAYEDYLNALDQRTLTFASIDASGNRSDLVATFNNLFSVNAANTATGNHYALIDSRGRVVVPEELEDGYSEFTHMSGTVQNANLFALYMVYGDVTGGSEFSRIADQVLNERMGTDSHLADLYDYAVNGRDGRGGRSGNTPAGGEGRAANHNAGGNVTLGSLTTGTGTNNYGFGEGIDDAEETPNSTPNSTPNQTPNPKPTIVPSTYAQAERQPAQQASATYVPDRSTGNNGSNSGTSSARNTNSAVKGSSSGSKGATNDTRAASSNNTTVNNTRTASRSNTASTNSTSEVSAENAGIQLARQVQERTNTTPTTEVSATNTNIQTTTGIQDIITRSGEQLRDGDASLSAVYSSSHTEEVEQFLNYFFNRYRTEIFNNTQLEASALPNFDYYVRMFNAIEQHGGCISIESFDNADGSAANNSEWLTAMIESGQFSLELFNTDAQGNVTLSGIGVDSDENLSFSATTQIDKRALAKAEAAYEQAMRVIDRKEKKIDMELNKIETERNALTKEYDSVKKVAEDNIERTFGIFS